jgi:hypothetical protein
MKAVRWLFFISLICGSISLVVVSPVLAQGAAAPTETSITLQTTPLLDDKGHVIAGRLLIIATLATADGQPLSMQKVSFFERVEFIGGVRNADLGSALTDSTGVAVVAYQPSTLAEHAVWAHFDGTADHAASDTPTMNARVDTLSPTFLEPEASPLEGLRQRWFPWSVAAIVLATWAVVIGALVRAVVGIRTAQSRSN